MSRSKDIKKAVEWCKKARDLLKIPREYLWAVDSQESLALEKAIAAVEERIKDLEKEKNTIAADLMTKRFSELAKLAQKVVENGNKELARSLTAELNTLANTNGIPTQVQQQETEKSLEVQYKTSLQRAEGLFKELGTLNTPPHLFQGAIQASLTAGKNLASSKDYLGAIETLGMVPGMHKVQLARNAQFQLFPRKRDQIDSIANMIHHGAKAWPPSGDATCVRRRRRLWVRQRRESRPCASIRSPSPNNTPICVCSLRTTIPTPNTGWETWSSTANRLDTSYEASARDSAPLT